MPNYTAEPYLGQDLPFAGTVESTVAVIIREPLGLAVLDPTADKVEMLAKHPYLAAWEPGGQRLAFIDADDSRQIRVLSPTNKGWVAQMIQHEQFVEGITWRQDQRR